MATPFKILTYCVCCHDTRPHYYRDGLSYGRDDVYECCACLHLVYAKKSTPVPEGTETPKAPVEQGEKQ